MDAAREVFADRGVDGATTREIAQRAGVDPAMIAHYFGSKGGLFDAVTALQLDPRDVIAPVLDVDADEAARQLVSRLLQVWDAHSSVVSALLRSAARNKTMAAQMRSFILDRAVHPVVARFSPDDAEVDTRSALLASQLTGVILTRYVLRWEPLASADPAWVVDHIAPTVQRYLTGPLPPGPASAG
nr:TetR family transcriptional regulator [Planctomonas sp. JC2975]